MGDRGKDTVKYQALLKGTDEGDSYFFKKSTKNRRDSIVGRGLPSMGLTWVQCMASHIVPSALLVVTPECRFRSDPKHFQVWWVQKPINKNKNSIKMRLYWVRMDLTSSEGK